MVPKTASSSGMLSAGVLPGLEEGLVCHVFRKTELQFISTVNCEHIPKPCPIAEDKAELKPEIDD